MKKLLILLVAICASITTNAQIFKSSHQNKQNKINASSVYVRAGVNLNYLGGWHDLGVGYEFLFGCQQNMGTKGAHFNIECGMNTRGCGNEYVLLHQLYLSPKFGWSAPVSNKVKFDPHCGVFAGYDVASSGIDDEPDNVKFDYGYSAGFGIWVNNRWNFDVELKQGLHHDDDNTHSWSFSVAYAF